MEMHVFNENSVDPDQTPRCVTSDLRLHCLLMSHLRVTRHEQVNQPIYAEWTILSQLFGRIHFK